MQKNSQIPNLVFKQIQLGPMNNYIYIIGNSQTQEAVVVDPAWDTNAIRLAAEEANLNIVGALITHGHPDHINGIDDLLTTHDIPIYVSKHEASFYKPITENLKEVSDMDSINLGEIQIDFLHTPGHTPGSQCFLLHGNLVSGDTLFLDGCGRCDLPGGDLDTMLDTLANRLCKLPDSTIIFPGHNYHHLHCDSLEHQKQSNPYLSQEYLQSFINQRGFLYE